MNQEKGTVSVSTENIFPIIRKWLYSDRDIFLRELVSNAADAIRKLERLVSIGEAHRSEGEGEPRIVVRIDREAGTISVTDNGIGMTADEVRRYINQIAFSGAVDFVEKYKDKGADDAGIIGHFGLGFYSSFMVSDRVRLESRSVLPDAVPAVWESEDGVSYVLGDGTLEARGTCVTLFLSEDGKEFLETARVRDVLMKYCAFMPYPIYLETGEGAVAAEAGGTADSGGTGEADDADDAAYAADDGEAPDGGEAAEADGAAKAGEAGRKAGPAPLNDVSPLWLKNPRDCTDEEYKAFYHKAFSDFRDPLFWIHLNMDYPFRVKGILYFPPMDNPYEVLEGRIKLYYNQVFVADNIKEVIPDFLFLLKGCLDCPDLPLNVSRSFLQNDGQVRKMSSHIVRKVADRLQSLFETARPDYETYWKDIGPFVKYGCLRDEKFCERMTPIVLYRTVDEGFKVLADLGESILYTADADRQAAYVRMARSRGRTVAVLDHELDTPFMSHMEMRNPKVRFARIDAELGGEAGAAERADTLARLFRDAAGDPELQVEVRALGETALPAFLSESEHSRRMQEMRRMFERTRGPGADDDGFAKLFPVERKLVLNTDSPLVHRLADLYDDENRQEQARELALHLHDLARLGHGSLDAAAMASFLERAVRILGTAADAGTGS